MAEAERASTPSIVSEAWCVWGKHERSRRMDTRGAGIFVIVIGIVIVVGGLLLLSGSLSWLGRLPGDIRVEREHVRVYIPIVTMVLISVIVSAILWAIRRLF
jgi:uncharacterized membrane protein